MKCFMLHLDNAKSRRKKFEKWLKGLKNGTENGSENLFDVETCNDLNEVSRKLDPSDSLVLICIFVEPKNEIESYDKDEFNGEKFRNQMWKLSSTIKVPIILYINDTYAKSQHADYYPLTLFMQCSNIYLTFNTSQVAYYLRQLARRNSSNGITLDQTPELIHDAEIAMTSDDPRLKVLLELNTKANVPIKSEIDENIEEDDINYQIEGFGQCYIVSGESDFHLKEHPNLNSKIAENVRLIKKTLGKCRYGLDVTTTMKKYSHKELLDNLKEADFIDTDCFVIFFIGLIDAKFFTCPDYKKVEIQTIIDTIERFETLSGKPKILIFQNPLKEVNKKPEFTKLLELMPGDKIKLPKDFLLIHSTCYKLKNQPKKSLNFVRQLLKELEINCPKYDFVKLLQSVFVKNVLQPKNSEFDNVYIKSKLPKFAFNVLDDEDEDDSGEVLIRNLKDRHFKQMAYRISNTEINYPPVKNGKCVILRFLDPASNSISNSQEFDSDSNERPHKKQRLNSVEHKTIYNVDAAIKKLKKTFKKFSIKPIVKDVFNYDNSKVIVDDELKKIHTAFKENPTDTNDIDCFFLFLFTNNHPEAGTTREQIAAYFDEHEAMFGRPKFIFVQDIQKGSTKPSDDNIEKSNKAITIKYKKETKISIARYADTIIFFNNGAPVEQTINSFCDKLLECATTNHACNQNTCMHIAAILSSVLKKLKSSSRKLNFYLPYISSTLTRHVYLQPVCTVAECKPIPIVNRGKFVVMNYVEFDKREPRKSSNVDKRYLVKTLRDNLKFEEILVPDNLNALDTRLFLNHTIESGDFKNSHCFVLCFLSHGDFHEKLYCKIGFINQKDLVSALCNNKSLKRKPKIIIIQACQGGAINEESAIVKSDDEEEDISKDDNPYRNFKYTYKQHSNLLIVTSSYPGHLSFRKKLGGSLFIDKLCTKIVDNPDTDLLTICTMVCRDIGYHYKKKHEPYKRQLPHIFHTLVDPIVFASETPKLA